MELLLEEVGEVEKEDSTKRTPLSYAAAAGNHNIVEMLLTRGVVGIESKDINGLTPRSYAELNGHVAIAYLLEHFSTNGPSP